MSEIITNKLTGKTAAGDVTITSEGGSATMQLQQGVAKFWINVNTSTFVVADSLNNSSNTDNGLGLATHSFTNSMNNSGYNFNVNRNGSTNSTNGFIAESNSESTSSISTSAKYIDSNSVNLGDASRLSVSIRGDLA